MAGSGAGLDQPPPDLRGRGHPDRLFRALGDLISGYAWLTSRASLGCRPVRRVGRELILIVQQTRVEAAGVRSFRLIPTGGGLLPRWQPGAHLDVLLPSGRRRQYSLCGDPADRSAYRIAVRLIAGGAGGSRELHESVGTGCALSVRGPRNAFPFVPASHYLFLAGGIGITPILPIVKHAAVRGTPWHLVYTGRCRDSMPFLDELSELDPDRVLLRPYDQYGFLSGTRLLAHAPPGATVYCCGPPAMIASLCRDFPTSAGSALHVERFTAPPIGGGEAFDVRLQRSDRVVRVPADRSVLDILQEVLPTLPYSCRRGFCGTCRTRVIAGGVAHYDQVLTPQERIETMTICVSRSRGGPIILDL
jgi:ferredoxin-NADP reductase